MREGPSWDLNPGLLLVPSVPQCTPRQQRPGPPEGLRLTSTCLLAGGACPPLNQVRLCRDSTCCQGHKDAQPSGSPTRPPGTPAVLSIEAALTWPGGSYRPGPLAAAAQQGPGHCLASGCFLQGSRPIRLGPSQTLFPARDHRPGITRALFLALYSFGLQPGGPREGLTLAHGHAALKPGGVEPGLTGVGSGVWVLLSRSPTAG